MFRSNRKFKPGDETFMQEDYENDGLQTMKKKKNKTFIVLRIYFERET